MWWHHIQSSAANELSISLNFWFDPSRELHAAACAAARAPEPPARAPEPCPLCGVDLRGLRFWERQQHSNSCLDADARRGTVGVSDTAGAMPSALRRRSGSTPMCDTCTMTVRLPSRPLGGGEMLCAAASESAKVAAEVSDLVTIGAAVSALA